MENRTDEELLRAALAGDMDSFGILVEGCREDILRELTGLTGNVHDAEDVLQEAVLRSYSRLASLRSPFNYGGWLRVIARNMARNRLSRDIRHLPLKECHRQVSEADMEEPDSHDDGDAERALLALSRLSSKLRETSRLVYLSSLSQKQAARRLNLPVGTVKRRLWESRRLMRKEVLRMSKMRSGGSSHGIAPKIEVRDLPEEQLDIVTQGPGLYFGTVLENGHCETCRFYDYPGGILTQTVTTRVMRKVKILDEDCFEVLIEHSDCQPPEPNLLDYFSVSNAGFHWIMRVVADENLPVTRFMDRDREIFPLKYSVGEHEDYHARTVELTMGDDFRQRCLAVFWGWKNGTPVESYFTVEGRQVLHRRFVGPGAPESSNYQYEKLLQEMRRPFRGKDYRLWYETVLLP